MGLAGKLFQAGVNLKDKFPSNHRDAVEAALLAIWCHQAPRARAIVSGRPISLRERRITTFRAPVGFRDPKKLKLTEQEREAIVHAFTSP